MDHPTGKLVHLLSWPRNGCTNQFLINWHCGAPDPTGEDEASGPAGGANQLPAQVRMAFDSGVSAGYSTKELPKSFLWRLRHQVFQRNQAAWKMCTTVPKKKLFSAQGIIVWNSRRQMKSSSSRRRDEAADRPAPSSECWTEVALSCGRGWGLWSRELWAAATRLQKCGFRDSTMPVRSRPLVWCSEAAC